jgi:uncharacterized protein
MPIASPCIRVCTMDPATDLCVGCGRTLAEIARWGTMSETERDAVMAALPARQTQGERTARRAARMARGHAGAAAPAHLPETES